MKKVQTIFGTNELKKSISNFLNILDDNVMIKIKGGDNGDAWPPQTGDGDGGS